MKKSLFSTVLLLGISISAFSQETFPVNFFNQPFTSSTSVNDYFIQNTYAGANNGIFDGLSIQDDGTTSSVATIASGKLKITKPTGTTDNRFSFYRKFAFSTTPKHIKVAFKFTQAEPATANTVRSIDLIVGKDLTPDLLDDANANIIAHFAIGTGANANTGKWGLRDISNSTQQALGSQARDTEYMITWFINNSEVDFSFTDPTGSTNTLPANTNQVWVNNAVVNMGQAINDPIETTGLDFNSFKIRSGHATSPVIAIFDDFSISGETSTTLPVSLTSFTGNAVDNGILLNWKTVSEKNNERFDLFRSTDGNDFAYVGTRSGNNSSGNLYNFIDRDPSAGANYYKLLQVDFDGNSTPYFCVVNNAFDSKGLSIYARENKIDIRFNSPKSIPSKVTIFDLNGKIVMEKQIEVQKGTNVFDFQQNLIPGIYVLKIDNVPGVFTQKFVK
jgi:hypothetical protein